MGVALSLCFCRSGDLGSLELFSRTPMYFWLSPMKHCHPKFRQGLRLGMTHDSLCLPPKPEDFLREV